MSSSCSSIILTRIPFKPQYFVEAGTSKSTKAASLPQFFGILWLTFVRDNSYYLGQIVRLSIAHS
jgi:hypothetical protein